ncbi:MAG: hypothetical protein FJ161_05145, partial [Gammaproteobacteria bacterium]|nr:hypothetical protein [Gammaproteobacteria bacterium]
MHKPLMVACSGGGGHIAAIKGIIDYTKKHDKSAVLKEYDPTIIRSRPFTIYNTLIKVGSKLNDWFVIKAFLKKIRKYLKTPVLPGYQELRSEVEILRKNNQNRRPYIDMLIDVYPSGYYSAALWNVLQRNDNIEDLKILVSMQAQNDALNYNVVYQTFYDALVKSALNGEPFTEIVSTQAMGLKAMCAAVRDYNQWIEQSCPKHLKHQTPPIHIKQYLTDIATVGAVHFFEPLSHLSDDEKSQMSLYGVGLTNEIMQHFFKNTKQTNSYGFRSINAIEPENNPTVRPGFSDRRYDFSQKKTKDREIKIGGGDGFIKLQANERLASVMLGSQAGLESAEYILPLLENSHCDKIAIFGALSNESLKKHIESICENHPNYASKIIMLGPQNDAQISAIMTASDVVVTRSGGLSVQEQLAMNHAPNQAVFLHYSSKNEYASNLTSGISWEDANANYLVEFFTQKNVFCNKTTPRHINRALIEKNLIWDIKKYHNIPNPEKLISDINLITDEDLTQIWSSFLELKEHEKSTFFDQLQKTIDDVLYENSQTQSEEYNQSRIYSFIVYIMNSLRFMKQLPTV